MVKVGIVGGTGYTGVELLRLLAQHPQARVEVITSRSEAGLAVADMYPNLRGHYDGLAFSVPDIKTLGACDVVFFATPHGVAHALAGELLAAGTKVIDLSADFRLQDADEWAKWYGQPHGAPELLDEAVYGLPEVNREQIKKARLIAVPGCYPTATQLGFLPLLEAGLADTTQLIADCKSGVSGAGRGASVGSLVAYTVAQGLSRQFQRLNRSATLVGSGAFVKDASGNRKQMAFFLDNENFIEPLGEVTNALRIQWPHHAHFVYTQTNVGAALGG